MPVAYLWAYLTRSPQHPNGDPICLYGSLLVAWLLGCLITIGVYRHGTWKRRSLTGAEGDSSAPEILIPEGGF